MAATDLPYRHCASLAAGTPPLDAEQAGNLLEQLHADWTLSDDHKTISRTFQRLLPGLALAVGPGVAPPRLHCLRHSFAVATLLRWYRSGIDPAARLNYLSTFLGHVNPTSTAVYLSITAELLEQANARFERFAAPLAKGGNR